jgi:phosphopantothenoylcysteine decarboxylase/phosphopantothenate--cysteine ligase
VTDLQGQHVVLGVTGGIAAYKSPDLVRRLREQGAEVTVIMTASAERLVSPTVFQAVSGEPVRGDLWDEKAESAMGHIELARWADLILIAPATANLMAQLAGGSAENLLTTVCLASDAPVVLAPAMNQAMWRNASTQANRKKLEDRNVRFIGPEEGEQACGDEGPGRMTEPVDIVARLGMGKVAGILRGLQVMVTAGPTREAIDPVRFVSNKSSGKMGFAIARAAADAGALVTLIAGPVSLTTPKGVERVDVESATDMYDAAMDRISGTDIYIGAAAISDYRPAQVVAKKIKKTADTFSLEMVKSPDLLAAVAALDNGPFTVGFAAETDELEKHALAKLEAKRLDMIVANLVGDGVGFDRDDNSAVIMWEGSRQAVPNMAKTELARQLVAMIASRYRAAAGAKTGQSRPAAS